MTDLSKAAMSSNPVAPITPDRFSSSDDHLTVIAIGVLAATLAAICHETIGHGLACIGEGGRITLLTSIWFQCRGGASLTDAGGSIASLLAGSATFLILAFMASRGALRLALVLFTALSLFWFAAQLIDHPIVNRDDWAFIAQRMRWPWIWRPIAVAIALLAYAFSMRAMLVLLRRPGAPGRHAIRLAYAAAAASAGVAGLMWSPAPFLSAKEGLLTLGVAPIGLLVVTRWVGSDAEQRSGPDSMHPPISRSWAWIIASCAVFGIFLFVQARGLGALAEIGLPPR